MEKEELLSPIGKSDMERRIDLLRMDSAGKFRCLQGLSKSPLRAKEAECDERRRWAMSENDGGGQLNQFN